MSETHQDDRDPAGDTPAGAAPVGDDPPGRVGGDAGWRREGSPLPEAGSGHDLEVGAPRSDPGSPSVLDPQSDQWLVDKARGGDPDAWEVLIRRHRDRIYRIALRMLGDPDDAEDVTQDVAVVLLSALAGFIGGSSFTTWLYRIVINRSLNHQRRRPVTRGILESDHPAVAGPERAIMARGRAAATAAALAALPTSLRAPLVLHEMEGLSYQEVATILNAPEPTVRGRIYRARRTLLADLREWS